MITAVSILLYVMALLFAYIAGATGRQGEYAGSGFGVVISGVLFVVAVVLQIWG